MAEDCEVKDCILRSENSLSESFVRFVNNSNRNVDVIWVDFEGRYIKYKTLSPGTFLDMNTYATHPWLFLDSATQDRLVVKSKEVFLPEPWDVRFQNLTRENFPRTLERTPVYITNPLYTLRERSLQVVRNTLLEPEDAFKLELPNSLQKELAVMVKKIIMARSTDS